MLVRNLYSALTYSLTPLALARLLVKARRNPAYLDEIPQRLGFGAELVKVNQRVWFHCVSVGETIASAGLIRLFLAEETVDRVLVSSTTPTGFAQVFSLFGHRVEQAYLPIDMPGATARFLDRTQPTLAVLLETELWPNLLHNCWKRDIPTVLANARLSERSARGYRYLGRFARTMLRELDLIIAQTEVERQRFIQLGAHEQHVHVGGSIKFDVSPDESLRRRAADYRDCWGRERPVWIAASTHRGEEKQVIEAHRRVLKKFPEALLVLVPRHQERFDEVSALVHESGMETVRQTQVRGKVSSHARIVVADLLGELPAMLGGADLAFVGGSLVKRGGHNLIEPAAWALPVLSGPHTFNFQDIRQRLQDAGGLIPVKTAAELGYAVVRLLGSAQLSEQCGRAAASVVKQGQGATLFHYQQIKALLNSY